MTPLLAFQSVSMTYPSGARAVEAFDLEVAEGDFVSLIGPSGCGKTTLLRLAAGFETPTSGVIRFRGKPVQGPDAERAVLFQDVRLFPFLTLRDNLRFSGRVDDGRLSELAERFLLTEHLHKRPHTLSLGTRQRGALARVLANEPAALLCDEPFSSLDDRTRCDLQEALLDVWRERRMTVVFVTHNVGEAVSLSRRVAVLTGRPGRLHALLSETDLDGDRLEAVRRVSHSVRDASSAS